MMKHRILSLFMALLMVTTLCLSACNKEPEETYAITFMVDGETYFTLSAGDLDWEFPAKPKKDGFIFKGWFDENGKAFSTLPDALTGNISVKAQFIKKSAAPEPPPTYTQKGTYVAPAVMTELGKVFNTASGSEFSAYNFNSAPFALQDFETITDCTINAITLPIFKLPSSVTTEYTLTLSVITSTSIANLKKPILREYSIKVPKATKGLLAGEIFRIDLTSYNIKLAKGEGLAIGKAGDTLYPGYLTASDSSFSCLVTEKAPQLKGFYSHLGTANLDLSDNILLYDLEYDRVYANEADTPEAKEAAYLAAVEKVKAAYAGKYVSVMGDSISTYNGTTNNTSYNTTLKGYPCHYTNTNRLAKWNYTYWGRVIAAGGMKLCVANSWSGSRVYGQAYADKNGVAPYIPYADSSILRAKQLHNTKGQKPDVILIFMGINDVSPSPFGTLYDSLKKAGSAEAEKKVIDTFMSTLLTKTNNGTNIKAGSTYTAFDQAYALTLYNMKKAYPNAEIFCCNIFCHNTSRTDKVNRFNYVIEKLADYYDAINVDFYDDSGLTPETVHCYTRDNGRNATTNEVEFKLLHPNAAGLDLMARCIIRAMADHIDGKK